ncbi:MAG: hypothetical protein ABL958_14840 [Bdellovibrionia bacterium]
MNKLILTALVILVAGIAQAAPEATKTKYTKGKKQENFDAQVVEGSIYRPDLSVVTGDTSLGGFGTLKLRDDFVDHVANENAGEER